MKYLLVIFLFINSSCFCQEYNKLEEYLTVHSYTLDNEKNDPLDFLNNRRNVFFILSECNHELHLMNNLRLLVIKHLIDYNLKYIFIEYGRAQAFINNNFLLSGDLLIPFDSSNKYQSNYYRELIDAKKLYNSNKKFKYIGIDFERANSFYYAINNIIGNNNSTSKTSNPLFIKFKDSTYKNYDYQTFLKYYKQINYNKYDTEGLKNDLGANYNIFKYLITNPNTKSPTQPRTLPMFNNLLTELNQTDNGASYLLSIGQAHVYGKSLTELKSGIRKKNFLNDIIVLNTYCENCISFRNIQNENRGLKFMNGQVLEIFKKFAKTNLTIFDLSDLPSEFDYIKKNSDLLLFAKNQD